MLGFSTSSRTFIQFTTAVTIIPESSVAIKSIGNVTGQGSVQIGTVLSFVYTVMCTGGATNSINMIDGVHGSSRSVPGVTLRTLTAKDVSSIE